ncbi:CUB and sushi domain-containing protein 3 [Aphelenchoides bicaudatus]|nr:CUB and sushi domain-containing protein 3 [Aphelenchoides bicaudatus]
MHSLSVFLIFVLYFQTDNAVPISKLFGLKPVCPPTDLKATSGYIKSLNFPQNYSNQLDCSQIITVEEGHIVQLIFYAFETELGADVVTLYDGEGRSKKEIVQLSGFDAMHTIYKTSNSNIMTVRFQTDIDTSYSASVKRRIIGFYGFYQGILPQQRPVLKDCSRSTEFKDKFGVIVSPEWPEQYPNRAYCLYTIKVATTYSRITVRVNYFDTEPNADVVMIYKGAVSPSNLIKTMSGTYNEGYKFEISGTVGNLVFISDLDNQYPGYSFTYVAT